MAQRMIAVSLKARGLSAAERPAPLAWCRAAGHEVLDVGVAVAAHVVLLSASCWLGVAVSTVAVCFFAFYPGAAGASASMAGVLVPVALLVHLPALWLAQQGNSRRLAAARHLAAVQSRVLAAYALHGGLSAACTPPRLLAQLDDALSDTVVHLRGYLAHDRPLASRHFSPGTLRTGALPADSPLLLLGRNIGQRLRRLHSCLRRLVDVPAAILEQHCAGAQGPAAQQGAQQALALLQLLVGLADEVLALAALKDLRSPLLLRVMLRTGCVLVAPMLAGAWLAGLAGSPPSTSGVVFAIVVGAILEVLLMTVLTLGLMLEDPFDSGDAAPPDALSLHEWSHGLAYVRAASGGERPSALALGGAREQPSLPALTATTASSAAAARSAMPPPAPPAPPPAACRRRAQLTAPPEAPEQQGDAPPAAAAAAGEAGWGDTAAATATAEVRKRQQRQQRQHPKRPSADGGAAAAAAAEAVSPAAAALFEQPPLPPPPPPAVAAAEEAALREIRVSSSGVG